MNSESGASTSSSGASLVKPEPHCQSQYPCRIYIYIVIYGCQRTSNNTWKYVETVCIVLAALTKAAIAEGISAVGP